MRIRTHLIGAALLVVVIANIVYGLYFLDRERREARQRFEAAVEETDRLLGAVLAGPVEAGDPAGITAVLEAFLGEPDIVHIALVDARGAVLVTRGGKPPAPHGELIEHRLPLRRAGRLLGEVVVTYGTASIEQRLRRAGNELLLLSLIWVLALATVILLGVRGLTRPIDRLTEAVEAMAAGRLDSRIEPGGVHEVAVLGESFIRMREAIREQQNALERKARELGAEVAQRREAERRLGRLTSIIEAATDLVAMADLEGRVLYLNRAGRELLGIGARGLSGLRMVHLYPDGAAEVIFNIGIPTALRDGYWSGDTVLRALDGREIPVSQVIVSHREADGGAAYISTVIRDITERKGAEQALRELAEKLEARVRERTAELEAANRELEAFSYSVSHDLRAPLRAIDGFSRMLMEDYAAVLDAKGRDYVERIRRGVQRMGALIDDLLQLARVSRRELCPAVVDLTRLAEDVVTELRGSEPGREVEVSIQSGLQAWGDPGLLRAVLANLLGNAWKYTGRTPRPRIEFGAVQIDGGCAYCVRDNGVGFDMRQADKLFLPFQRLHAEREFPGTGVGLATVARIVHRHGGRVWAEGEPGAGAVFCFTLPQPPAEPGAIRQQES